MNLFDGTVPDYEVSIPVFEGPMDLLLHLVVKNRVDIQDIPIHEITDQYLAYLSEANQFDMALGSSFFLMATELLYIKSRMLLPARRQEEEDGGEDPRRELARSLEEFRRMKEIKAHLEDMMEQEVPYRTREPEQLKHAAYQGKISLQRLTAAFCTLYEAMEKEQSSTVFVPEEVSLDAQIDSLRGMIHTHPDGFTVHAFFSLQNTRLRLAVALLALLELLRLGEAKLQDTVRGLSIGGKCV